MDEILEYIKDDTGVSNMSFTNCSMIAANDDGNSYEWNGGSQGAAVTMPAKPVTGNNGYARITRIP